MHPILFELGPVKIYSYGLMVAFAAITATFLAGQEARRKKIAPEKIFNLSICLVICGALGARILYVLQNLKFYLIYPSEILMLHKGGLSFYGGFILAVIGAVILLKRQQLPVLDTLDIISPYLALAQAIGRIGCFLNGCCYGIGEHPVQLYSSLGLLLIFVILRVFQARIKQKRYFAGQVFLLYCSLYSFMRFFMEYLRADNMRIFANLTLHQIISAVIFVSSCIIWWRKGPIRFYLRGILSKQGAPKDGKDFP